MIAQKMLVVLDTNVIRAAGWGRGGLLGRVVRYAKLPGDSIAIPNVVLDELRAGHSTEAAALLHRLRAAHAALDALPFVAPASPPTDADLGRATANYARWLDAESVIATGVARIPYPAVSHPELVKRSALRIMPFTEGDRGYRDCLVWESLVETAKQHESEVALVSEDRKAFSDGNERLHPALQADADSRCGPGRVSLFVGLRTYWEHRIAHLLTTPAGIREQLRQNEFEGFDLIKYLDGQLLEALPYRTPDDVQATRFEMMSPVVTGVYGMTVDDVEELTVSRDDARPDELLVEGLVRVSVIIGFEVHRDEVEIAEEELGVTIRAADYSRHYREAEIDREALVSFDLLLDVRTKNPSDFHIEHVALALGLPE